MTEESTLSGSENFAKLTISDPGEQFKILPSITAFSASAQFGRDVPALYRRTWLLGVAFGPAVAAVAGLFDYDCEVWVFRAGKFRPVLLTKRKGL